MDNRRIGDLDVFPLGLGCMQLSGRRMIDRREQALATIHTALDAGITLLDTANIYAPDAARIGHNEELVAEAVSSYAGRRPVIATKGGITRVPGTDADVWGRAGTPDALREYLHGDYLILYTLIGSKVHLLSIRHHRQLSFAFEKLWEP